RQSTAAPPCPTGWPRTRPIVPARAPTPRWPWAATSSASRPGSRAATRRPAAGVRPDGTAPSLRAPGGGRGPPAATAPSAASGPTATGRSAAAAGPPDRRAPAPPDRPRTLRGAPRPGAPAAHPRAALRRGPPPADPPRARSCPHRHRPQGRHVRAHAIEHVQRALQGHEARLLHGEEAAGAPLALGATAGGPRAQVALALEALEGRVHGTQRGGLAGALLQLGPHRHAVRLIAQAKDGQKHQLLERARDVLFEHLSPGSFYKVEVTPGSLRRSTSEIDFFAMNRRGAVRCCA